MLRGENAIPQPANDSITASPTFYERDSRTFLFALIAVVLLGAGIRIAYFGFDGSLRGDEAALALNLQSRQLAELTRPLENNQHAPLAYLVTEKLIFDAYGLNEQALRFPSLIASLISLPLFCLLMSTIGCRKSLLVGTILFACSPMLVRYSAEMKPYSGDVVATLLIFLVGYQLHKQQFSWPWLLVFAVLGVLSLWVSFTSIFVLFGVGITLIGSELYAGRWRSAVAMCLVAIAWQISFVTYYLLITRSSLRNTELLSFWKFAFAPLPPRTLWECRRLVELLLSPFTSPLQFGGVALPAALFLFGTIAIWKRHAELALFCLAPIAVTYLCSGLHLYPFAQRLILFLVPLLLIPVAVGVGSIRTNASPNATLCILLGLLLMSPLLEINDMLKAPDRSGVRDVLERLAKRHKPGDALYVYYYAGCPFFLYYQGMDLKDVEVIHGSRDLWQEQRHLKDLDALAGRSRVWFLFSETHTDYVDEEKLMLLDLERRGRRIDTIEVANARAYLYDLSAAKQ